MYRSEAQTDGLLIELSSCTYSPTQRRMCVLMAVASGWPSKSVAALLQTTRTTIDNDVCWWLARVHAQGRAHLGAIALELQLLHASDIWFDGSQASLEAFLARHARNAEDRLTQFMSNHRVKSVTIVRTIYK